MEHLGTPAGGNHAALLAFVSDANEPMAVFGAGGRLEAFSRPWQVDWADRIEWPLKAGTDLPAGVLSLPLPDGKTLVVARTTETTPPKNRFLALIESLPFAIGVHRDLKFVYVNRCATDYLGFASPQDLVGRPIISIVPPHELPNVSSRVGHMMATGEPLPERATQLIRADGRLVTAELSAFAIDDFDGLPSYVVVARDVTERLVYEERLQQIQRMEAVGRLAGGIAHDFNNVLSIILSYADILTVDLRGDTPAAEAAREIRDAAMRAAAMTRRLLTISRGQTDTLNRNESTRVGAVVEGLQSLLKRLVGREVRLEVLGAEDDLRVGVGTSQLEQVFLNLVINARDAMPGGGTITISLTRQPCPDAVGGAAPVPCVLISVSDNGVGMPDIVRERAFEPFFTTKGPGQGTGLGLSTVFGIAQQAGGAASIDSIVDGGTTVRVWLPEYTGEADLESAGEVPTPAPLAAQPDAPTRKSSCGHVMVVEDDAAVRVMVARILSHAGFSVDEAESAEALLARPVGERLPAPTADRPVVLVTDVVMGECSGPELAITLRAEHPDLPVLFMSGFTEELLEPRHNHGGPTSFLAKPFTPQALLAAVRALAGC